MTTTSNIHVGLAGWSNATYAVGARRSNGGQAYQVITAGTSTAPPTGTASDIAPGGTAHWKWLSAVDYTTLQAWADAIPTTLTQPIVGLVWNDGLISATLGNTLLNLTGHTTSSSNTITLKPAPGEGFASQPPTTPYTFNAANGAAIQCPASGVGGVNYLQAADNYVILEGLQVRDPNGSSGSTILSGGGQNVTVRKCIIDGYSQGGGANMIDLDGTGLTLTNNLIIDRGATTDTPIHCQASGIYVANNTFISPSLVAGKRVLDCGSISTSNANTARNNIFINFDTVFAAVSGAPWATDHNAYTAASFVIANNGTDTGGSVFGVSPSSVFVNSASDFHLKAGSPCLNVGVVDAAVPDDAFGNTRPQGALPDIGAHELLAGTVIYRDAVVAIALSASRSADNAAAIAWTRTHAVHAVAPVDWAFSGITVSSAFPLESLSTQPSVTAAGSYSIDPVFPIEFATRAGLPISDAVIALEWGRTHRSDVFLPASWAAQTFRDLTIPYDAALTMPSLTWLISDYDTDFDTDFTSPIVFVIDPVISVEFGAGRSVDVTLSLEASSSIARSSVTPIEWALSSSFFTSVAVPVEWGASIRANATVPLDWGRPIVTADAAFPIDWRGWLSSDVTVSVAPVSGLAQAASFTTDWSMSVSAAMNAPVSFATTARVDAAFPTGFSQSQARDVVVAIEPLGSRSADAVLPLDLGWGRFVDISAPVAWSANPLADLVVPIETSGSFGVSASFSLGFSASLNAGVSEFPLEHLASVSADGSLPAEWGHLTLSVASDAAFSMEVLSVVQSDIVVQFPVHLGRLAIGSSLMPDEWEEENAP